MIRRATSLAAVLLLVLVFVAPASAAEPPCELSPRTKCFGVESLGASLSTTQAGAHPDLSFSFAINQDPDSKPNVFGLKNAYAPTRNVRIDLPPGLIGDPNLLGVSEQCTIQELLTYNTPTGGCPNGSQVGVSNVFVYELTDSFLEPVYMMQPPGGDVVARLGFIAGIIPVYIDLKARSEGDYGISAEISDASTEATLIRANTTTWGVPSASSHDTERCTAAEAFKGCKSSNSHPPGNRRLPFLTNPTRCGVPLSMSVSAASWAEPARFDTKSAVFPQITGCNMLPFGPSLKFEPTSHRAAAPTGLHMTIKLPASEGVNVLEPSQTRYIKIDLPKGLAINPSSADGLATCSPGQVGFERRVASDCPDASKLADTEFDIPVLERKLRGSIYIREPEPGNPFRIWIVADDLGLHVKLPGQLRVDKGTGQIESIVIGTPRTEGIPQAPLREVNLAFKSGFRAPLVNPQACGAYTTEYEFVPWSAGPPAIGSTKMEIDEGCDAGGFRPKLSAGMINPSAGTHSPFVFTLTREDGEENPASLDISLPKGLAATFAGIPLCNGSAAASGTCSAASRIGSVTAAVGAGPTPLWVPRPGKRPTAVYLGGPYKGGPLSVVAVVPKQAGPFDFGDEVVRSAIYVNPLTAQATIKSDALPQMIEGIPVGYRTIHVAVDRPNFTLNPTGCEAKTIGSSVVSAGGATASPSARFAAVDCAKLGFKPRISLSLKGGTKRAQHPALRAVVRARPGDANLSKTVVALPHSAFLDQAHIRTICTRVQYAAGGGNGAGCPAGSVYGHVRAISPLLDEPLEGPVYLRSSNHNLPDIVFALHGLVDIEAVGRIDSVRGNIRSSFETIPDAPLSEVVLEMQGGKKGLIVNSTDLCVGQHRADAQMSAYNGKELQTHPTVKAVCQQRHRGKR